MTDGICDSGTTVRQRREVSRKCRICFQSDHQTPILASQNALLSDRHSFNQMTDRSEDIKADVQVSWIGICKQMIQSLYEDRKDQSHDHGLEFISPCRCSGSMAWVHRECLQTWRMSSTRSDSFSRCEQCFTEYRLKHTFWSGIFSNRILMATMTAAVLFISLLMALLFSSSLLQIGHYSMYRHRQLQYANGDAMALQNGLGGGRSSSSPYLYNGTDENSWMRRNGGNLQQLNRRDLMMMRGVEAPTDPAPAAQAMKREQQHQDAMYHPRTKDAIEMYREILFGSQQQQQQQVMGNKDHDGEIQNHKKKPGRAEQQNNIPLELKFTDSYGWNPQEVDQSLEEVMDLFDNLLEESNLYIFLWRLLRSELLSLVLPLAVAILASLALIRESSHGSCLLASALFFSTVAIYMVDWPWAVWMYPVPAAYGMVRFIRDIREGVEDLFQMALKHTSSDLLNYQS